MLHMRFPIGNRRRKLNPQQWCETDNPLWGVTVHPLNPDFTPGGSTGGEGALLSLGGAVVGWGTDIGGSIRIPSHMSGIYGLKPSVVLLVPKNYVSGLLIC